MSTVYNDSLDAQPPRLLRTAVEIYAVLRQLYQHHTPLTIQFSGRTQAYQSFIVEVDHDNGRIALDEVIAKECDRLLKQGELFSIESYHEGVRIAWNCKRAVRAGEFDAMPCYWLAAPTEVTYHQRRNAYRAPLNSNNLIPISLPRSDGQGTLAGHIMDISATGCKLRFNGDVRDYLHSGVVLENFSMRMPFGEITASLELRHVHFEERVKMSFIGVRFVLMNGLVQRNVERFVYQLQREARRLESESFL